MAKRRAKRTKHETRSVTLSFEEGEDELREMLLAMNKEHGRQASYPELPLSATLRHCIRFTFQHTIGTLPAEDTAQRADVPPNPPIETGSVREDLPPGIDPEVANLGRK